MAVIGFDVYGTLVDPLGMDAPLRSTWASWPSGSRPSGASVRIDWTFRRALMGRYVDFDAVTHDSFRITAAMLGVDLRTAEAGLLDMYRRLPAFADAAEGLGLLAEAGHRLVAFSNGVGATLRGLLGHARLMPPLSDVVSVDEVRLQAEPDRVPAPCHPRRAGRGPDLARVGERLGRARGEVRGAPRGVGPSLATHALGWRRHRRA